MTCSWQVEIDPFCRKVLAKHWPHVRRHDDVRTFPPDPIKDWNVDVICGGFPCQDISNAGKRAGIEGEQSGLWSEFARIVRLLRPRYVVVENVAAITGRLRGLHRILGNLASLGYDAEWHCVTAASANAPHIRDRAFVLGYAHTPPENPHASSGASRDAVGKSGCRQEVVAGRGFADGVSAWLPEPPLGRMVDGLPRGVVQPQLSALGNAVVPQVAELIGRRLVAVGQEGL
jgi:DNA (cytosine-5)-methyltransferase 1